MKGLGGWAYSVGRAIKSCFSLHLLRIHSLLSAEGNDLHSFFQKTKKVLALKNTTGFPAHFLYNKVFATNAPNSEETKVWPEGIHISHLCFVR